MNTHFNMRFAGEPQLEKLVEEAVRNTQDIKILSKEVNGEDFLRLSWEIVGSGEGKFVVTYLEKTEGYLVGVTEDQGSSTKYYNACNSEYFDDFQVALRAYYVRANLGTEGFLPSGYKGNPPKYR